MIVRADAMVMDDRRELQHMLDLCDRLDKGTDAIRRLFVDWCCEETSRLKGWGRMRLVWPTARPFPTTKAMALLQILWHQHGFPPELALRGLEELLKRWSTDIAAVLPSVVNASRMKTVAVRLAGAPLTK